MRPSPPARPSPAAQAFQAGDYRRAQALYADALARGAVDRAEALLHLSVCASALGDVRTARSHALALGGLPMPPPLRAQAVRRLHDVGEYEALVRLAASEDGGSPGPRELQAIGQTVGLAGLQTEALALTERALAAGTALASTHIQHGRLLSYHGRIDEAESAFEAALAMEPLEARALWNLAQLRRQAPGGTLVDRLRRALQRCRDGHQDEAPLAFGLFKALDDLGDHAGAWPALERGWRARRRGLAWREADEEALYRALGEAFPGPALVAAGAPEDDPAPVFVIGQPRTGSTLLERFLGQHPEVFAAGELFDFSHQLHWQANLPAVDVLSPAVLGRRASLDFASLGRRYLEHVRWRAGGRPVLVDKLPRNYLLAPFIARALPRARFVHTVRAPMDTCFSQLKELFANGYPHSYDPGEMARHYLRYRALMAQWREVLGDRLLELRYEDLVADPAASVARVTAFCGLAPHAAGEPVERVAAPVSTASAVQVREPVNRRGIGRWQPYAQALAPMAEALARGGAG